MLTSKAGGLLNINKRGRALLLTILCCLDNNSLCKNIDYIECVYRHVKWCCINTNVNEPLLLQCITVHFAIIGQVYARIRV
ncbi:MAG: hypothetical protein ACI9RO_001552 [Alteromonas macleodii]|jgi:hypothetical protein